MITLSTSQLPQRVFNNDLSKMWDYAEWFLGYNMPFLMIGVAVALVAGVIGIIIYIFTGRKADDDDEKDYDYY